MTSPKIVMDMTTTRPEFFRNLKTALRDMSSSIDNNHIQTTLEDKDVDMVLSPLPPRVLSQTLKLERWELTIQFNGQSKERRNAFMKTFERAFHRGGG